MGTSATAHPSNDAQYPVSIRSQGITELYQGRPHRKGECLGREVLALGLAYQGNRAIEIGAANDQVGAGCLHAPDQVGKVRTALAVLFIEDDLHTRCGRPGANTARNPTGKVASGIDQCNSGEARVTGRLDQQVHVSIGRGVDLENIPVTA